MSDLQQLAEKALDGSASWEELDLFDNALTPERVLAMLDVIDAARTLAVAALDAEGALLGYWTDVPEHVIQSLLPELRAGLEATDEALARLDALDKEEK